MVEHEMREVAGVIGRWEVPVDADVLATLFELHDRLGAVLTGAVGDFDRSEVWRDCGATSMTAWLRDRCRRSSREASTYTRTARRVAELPALAGAYRDGGMSPAMVAGVVNNLNDKTAPLFASVEDELVPTLVGMSVGEVSTAMQAWANAAKDSLHDPAAPDPEPPERRLHVSETLDGRRELSGTLDPEGGALTEAALRIAESPDVEGEPSRSPAQRRGDALVDIMRFFLDHQQTRRAGRHRPHLNIFLDYNDLAGLTGGGQTANGTVLDAATIGRLACDAGVHRVLTHGRSAILDYGMTTRTIPVSLFNALVARDLHCRFPGCDRPRNGVKRITSATGSTTAPPSWATSR